MTLVSGSGIFSGQRAQKGHLVRGTGGVAGEVADLRSDVLDDFASNIAMAMDDYTNEPAADPDAIKATFNSSTSIEVYTGTDLDGAVGTAVMDAPRNITVTTESTGTPSHVPATMNITGTDINNKPLTETVNVSQSNALVAGVKAFKTVTQIDFPAGDGATAEMTIGFGNVVGLSKPIKARTGLSAISKEILSGVLLAGVIYEEWTDLATADVDAIKTDIASNDSPVVYEGADLNGTIGEGVISPPRNFTITSSAHADVDAVDCVIAGLDVHGNVISDTITMTADAGATDAGDVAFAYITSITMPAHTGTNSTFSFGFGVIVGFAAPLKYRGADPTVLAESEDGTPKAYDALAGTYTAPETNGDSNGAVTHGTAPDASKDYAYAYEPARGTVVSAALSGPNGTYTPPIAPLGGMDWSLEYEYDASQNT